MAVKVPKVERIQPIGPESIGRIQAKVPDPTGPLQTFTKGSSDLATALAKTIDKQEKNAIDVASNEAINIYDRWHTEERLKLKRVEGDPTEAYNEFDRRAKEKLDNVLSGLSLSNRGRAVVQNRLNSRFNSLYKVRLTQEASHYDRYDEATKKSNVDISKRSAAESMAYVKAGDESTYGSFESDINNIRNLHIQRAIRLGSAQEVSENYKPEKGERLFLYQDDEGNERRLKLNPSVQFQIAEDVSEAATGAVQTLIGTNRVDVANEMLKKYKGIIDPVNYSKLADRLEEVEVEQKAFGHLAKLEGMGISEQKKNLRQLPSNTPMQSRIKQKAYELADARDRYKENKQRRESTQVYDQLMNQLIDRTDSTKTRDVIDNTVQLDNSVFDVNGQKVRFKDIIERVQDSKQRKALYAMVKDRSKTGDETKMFELIEKARQGQFYTMSATELQQEMTGLSEKQANKIISLYRMLNFESDGAQRARVNQAVKQARVQAEKAGVVSINSYTGQLTKKSKQRMNELISDITDDPRITDMGVSVQEANKIVKEHVNRKARELEQGRGWWDTLIDTMVGNEDEKEEKPRAVEPPPQSDFYDLPESDQIQLYNEYKKQHNGKQPQADEFLKWYEERNLDATE